MSELIRRRDYRYYCEFTHDSSYPFVHAMLKITSPSRCLMCSVLPYYALSSNDQPEAINPWTATAVNACYAVSSRRYERVPEKKKISTRFLAPII